MQFQLPQVLVGKLVTACSSGAPGECVSAMRVDASAVILMFQRNRHPSWEEGLLYKFQAGSNAIFAVLNYDSPRWVATATLAIPDNGDDLPLTVEPVTQLREHDVELLRLSLENCSMLEEIPDVFASAGRCR